MAFKNEPSTATQFCRICRLVFPFACDFTLKIAACPKCKTVIPLPEPGTDEYGIRTHYLPDDPPGRFLKDALEVFFETGHLPVGLDLEDTKKTYAECTHCHAFSDIDHFDCIGSGDPGNVFCFSCGKEFDPGVLVTMPPIRTDLLELPESTGTRPKRVTKRTKPANNQKEIF